MARPLTRTEEKRKVVIPPKISSGIETIAAAILDKIPTIKRKRLQRDKLIKQFKE